MLSIICRFLRKLLSELSGALITTVMVFGVFLGIFLNVGILRVAIPVMVVLIGIGFYVLSWFIADKRDRR